jgi:Uma2 family endonuclease
MSAIAEKLTASEFRVRFSTRKPNYELLSGEAVQKPLPTKLHSILQFVLAVMLKELGFKARPELTLAIDDSWEPTPDVSGILGAEEGPYPTSATAVAIEVLSPDDRYTRVVQKCRKYAEWGIKDILIFDPVERAAWRWDHASSSIWPISDSYTFCSLPAKLNLQQLWQRMQDELQ